MIYLNNTDTKIIEDALDVMYRNIDKLEDKDIAYIDALNTLLSQSKEYSIGRRDKAKAIIYEKRKTNKKYAH